MCGKGTFSCQKGAFAGGRGAVSTYRAPSWGKRRLFVPEGRLFWRKEVISTQKGVIVDEKCAFSCQMAALASRKSLYNASGAKKKPWAEILGG